MTTMQLAGGWLSVPYAGDEMARIEIGVSVAGSHGTRPAVQYPAYLDWVDGVRVAKIRPPKLAGSADVWLTVNGSSSKVGQVIL